MKGARSFLILIATVLLAGCTHLSRTEAIDIAKRAASHKGYSLEDYKTPAARFESGPDGKIWSVYFDGKIPVPGHHLSVKIDDRTGEAKVYGGK